MKKNILLSFLSLHLACLLAAQTNYTINEAWLFSGEGRTVNFPHTWNRTDAADEVPGYFRGTHTYRRNIYIGEEGRGRQISIDFEGANQVLELNINHQSVGRHTGGYTRFSFDITPYVTIGAENLFEIRVDNSYQADVPPLTADFTFFGGVYRDVSLSFTSPVHISKEDFGSSGVYITTPQVSREHATLQSTVVVKNARKDKQTVLIVQKIIAPTGQTVASSSHKAVVAPTGNTKVAPGTLKVVHPELWSPSSPALYTLTTSVVDARTRQTLDSVDETFGFRWFEFNADKGFLLNGEPLKLIGTCRHQCRRDMGNALPDEQHVEDINLLKNMGGNFLRIAHYPQDPYILSLCDKLGIVAAVEIPVVNAITESDAFLNNSLHMAQEMVKQSYNHPSLVLWGYMNEVLLRPPFKSNPERNKQYFREVNRQARALDSLIHHLDPYRHTTMAFHGSMNTYKEAGLIEIPDVVGWNLYQGWYGGGMEGFDSFLNEFHKAYPTTPFTISEYGADADPRLHSFSPERFDYTGEYATLYHRHYLKAILERPYVAGASLWNLNDFYSEERGNAVPHVNSKGITGDERTPKDSYYLYQAQLLKRPFIAIGSQSWAHRAGTTNDRGICLQPINIYTNLPQVEVTLNGKSLGTFAVNDRVATLNIPFVQGDNKLRASGSLNGEGAEDFYKCTFASVPGSWGYIGGNAHRPQTNFGSLPASDLEILNTDEDPIYQTQRTDLKAFKADVPDGEYAIYLYWAHLIPAQKNATLAYNLGNDVIYKENESYAFDVLVNGKEYLNGLNIPQQIGNARAIVKKISTSARNGSGLEIQFRPIGKTYLNAIRIVRMN